MRTFEFGVEDNFKVAINSTHVNGIFQKKDYSYIVSTSNSFYELANQKIAPISKCDVDKAVDIPEYNLIVVYSQTKQRLEFFSKTDLSEPLLKNFDTNQQNVKSLIYVKQSNILISIGQPTKAWKIHFINSEFSLSYIGSIHDDFNTYSIDSVNEILFYKINANIYFSRFSNSQSSTIPCDEDVAIFDYCSSSKRFIMHKPGFLILTDLQGNKLNLLETPQTSFLHLHFLHQNFVIAYDTFNTIYIYDIRLMKQVSTYKFPTTIESIFYLKQDLIIFSRSTLNFKKLNLPYKVWTLLSSQPIEIRRCNKFEQAARIMVNNHNHEVHFYSPRTKELLFKKTMKDECLNCIYDRGLFLNNLNGKMEFIKTHQFADRLLCPSKKTGISIYQLNLKDESIPYNSTAIEICEYNNEWVYCLFTINGEVVFINKSNFKEIDRVFICNKPCTRLLYHHRTRSLYIEFRNEINRFDFKAKRVVESIAVESNETARIHGDFLIVGFKNGSIQPFVIHEFQTFPVNMRKDHFHTKCVTDITFSSKFFVSSSLDATIKYWDYSFNLICQISLPFSVFTCELLNGKRDLLVGIETAILIINSSFAFDDEVDVYESKIDSFDLLGDELAHQKCEKEEEEEIEEAPKIVTKVIIKGQKTEEEKKPEPSIVKFITEPTEIDESVKPPSRSPSRTRSSRLKHKKKKNKTVITAIKTPRKPKEGEPEKKTEPPKQPPPPVVKRIPKVPVFNNPKNPRHSLHQSTVNRLYPTDLPKKSTNIVISIPKNSTPVVQTHVFDFNADDFFGKGPERSYGNYRTSTPNTLKKASRSSSRTSFSSTQKKISTQTSLVRIKRVPKNVY